MDIGAILWWCCGFPIVIIVIILIIWGIYSHKKKVEKGTVTEGSQYFDPDKFNLKTWDEKYYDDYGDFDTNKDIQYLIKNLPQVDDILNYQFKHGLSYDWQQEFGDDLYYGARRTRNINYIIEAIEWRRRLYNYLEKVAIRLNKFPDLYLYNGERNDDLLSEIAEFAKEVADDGEELIKIGRKLEEKKKIKHQNSSLTNAYKILGIKPSATISEINSARLKLVMKYHPDHNKSPGAAEKFMEIQSAYEIIMKNRQK